tara:strand:- start:82 stop:228 length:147 start_codon:yes stop_codon:yes gene_type:complete
MKIRLPIYLSKIIEKHPNILSGRKSAKESHERVVRTIKLISKYKLKKK